jgi:predicted nucleic acid-binding Zn ribbon protein
MATIPKPFREHRPGPRKATPRDRVLAQWRGVDLKPIETARAASCRKVGDLLPRVLQEKRFDRRLTEAEVMRVWNGLIDPTVVAHARPRGLHKGTLFVDVDSSPWLDEIVRYRRKEILDRLQHGFGRDLIVKISYRLG